MSASCHTHDQRSAEHAALRRVATLVGCVVASLAREDGWLVSTTPESYRRTLDPHDNMWRPTPRELAAEYERRGFETVRAEAVRIDDDRYFHGLKSRPSWVPVGERVWFPLPSFSDRARRRVPRWHWRESCVLARRVR